MRIIVAVGAVGVLAFAAILSFVVWSNRTGTETRRRADRAAAGALRDRTEPIV